MSSFCRHRRLEATCPICSRGREPKRPQRSAGPAAKRASPAKPGGRRRPHAGGVRVSRAARAAGDGYSSALVPGLRATADAELLARELVFSAARLEQLGGACPPGLYAEAGRLARAGEREEALWLLFLIALIGPSAGSPADAFDEIERARVRWAQAEQIALEAVTFGPRGARDSASAARAADAYRAWAARSHGQAAALAGEPKWTAERRFDRAFERLALPGLGRAQRYEYLLSAGVTGVAQLRASSLHLLSDPRDPTLAAAKRVFGIADPLLIARRAGELAAACELPLAALDLALLNWGRLTGDPDAGRITCGCAAQPGPGGLEGALGALAVHPGAG